MMLTGRQRRFFDLARQASLKSNFVRVGGSKVRIGAIIVNGNYTVSEGYNRQKTHTYQYYLNKSSGYIAPVPNIHAEMDALIRSGKHDLTGAEIFVYREFLNGQLANCKPCRSCMIALKKAGVRHLYYTNESGYNYERIF